MYGCCCKGCKTGRKGAPEGDKKATTHKFPKDPRLRKAWIKAIDAGEGFVLTPYTRICSRHFTPSCFQTQSADSNAARYKKMSSVALSIGRIKPHALPTLFPEKGIILPSVPLETILPPEEIAEMKKKSKTPNLEVEKAKKKDEINSIIDIKKKLNRTNLPKSMLVLYKEDFVLFYALSTQSEVPGVLYSLKIFEDLSFDIFAHGLPIKKKEVEDICSTDFVKKVSHLLNLLDFLTIMYEGPMTQDDHTRLAIRALETSPRDENAAFSNNHLDVITEQLSLRLTNKRGMRYSSSLINTSMNWWKISPILYNQIRDSEFLLLPGLKTVQRAEQKKDHVTATVEPTDITHSKDVVPNESSPKGADISSNISS